ncbi:hypothetical protein AWN76_010115 [Rhodothermaceae bacterium RA]|nr:hypothetical protein AWN76_010115 [Rhodothermaceae bacterium RA]
MSASPHPDVTRLLLDWSGGHREVLDRLMPLVYDELRRLARHHLRHERPDHTLTTTALVHEAYLNLIDQRQARWQNRAHFLAIAARAMRRILLQYARQRRALKRGGGLAPLPLEEHLIVAPDRLDTVIVLDEALARLEAMDERLGRVVTCRYFGGMTYEEIADVLGVSVRTVKRDWRTARAWLHRAMSDSASTPDDLRSP